MQGHAAWYTGTAMSAECYYLFTKLHGVHPRRRLSEGTLYLSKTCCTKESIHRHYLYPGHQPSPTCNTTTQHFRCNFCSCIHGKGNPKTSSFHQITSPTPFCLMMAVQPATAIFHF